MLFLSALVSSIANYLASLYLTNTIPNICSTKNPSWMCPSVEMTYISSIRWGAIGNKNNVFFKFILIF